MSVLLTETKESCYVEAALAAGNCNGTKLALLEDDTLCV